MPIPGVRTGRKPAPFVKPGITISEDLHGSKKRWVDSHPASLVPGDIIQGRGLIESGHIAERHTTDTNEPYLVVSFEMKNGRVIHYRAGVGDQYNPAEEAVRAFTEAEGEPVG